MKQPEVSHAFLIDPRSGIVHLVDAETAKSCCSPSWAARPGHWLAVTDMKQDRVCQHCLNLAYAMRATGAIQGAAIQPVQLEGQQIDPRDVPGTGIDLSRKLNGKRKPGL